VIAFICLVNFKKALLQRKAFFVELTPKTTPVSARKIDLFANIKDHR